MQEDNIYNSYDFAKKQRERSSKILLLGSFIVIGIVLVLLFWGFVTSLDSFKQSRDTVTQPIDDPQANVDEIAKQIQEGVQNYSNAGIPYADPAGRYEIIFMTPYPSSSIGIIFHVKDNATGDIKKEAEERVGRAKEVVDISQVSYINDY